MVQRILIVKLSSLGDVVHAMPAVQDLRRAFPQAQIDWVVEGAFAPLVARCEGVQQVIPCALRQWRKAPFSATTRREWNAFKARLQAQAYDAVIDLQGLSKSALVSWLARTTPAGKRYGLANQTEGSGFEAPARWVADVAIEIEPHVHAVQRSRILCAAGLGYALQGPAQCGLRPGALASVQPIRQGENPFVPKKAVVALVHGTSRADKEWPQSSWVELGRRLNHAGFAVALPHGNAAEKATSEAIAAQLADAWVWPAMALDAMTDTLAHCAGAVGVDSGVSHIAVALDLPHVQIYNFDTAWRTGPEVLAGTDAATAPRLPLRQVSVYGQPQPTVDDVWTAWDTLATPVLCR
ncbi:MAG: lipopolysaccharide heptosyltransferase I [Burkholderiaceae bacterium]|nr:lipopolysaccharide heptosyltransferase I [Burkholderiaceae bacterium]